jgi:hypothetical protein
MARLKAANPLHDGHSVRDWSRADEDDLLALLLAEDDSFAERQSSQRNPSRPIAMHGIRRVKLPVMAAAAVAAGLVVLSVYLSTSATQNAFAAWTATTTTPAASQLTAADSSCHHAYSTGIRLLPDATAGSLPSSLSPLVLTDSRGPFEMLVYSGSAGEYVCLWDSGVIGVGGGNGDTLPPPTSDSIGVPGVGFSRTDGGTSSLTYAHGHVGSDVTAVTLNLTDRTRVEATLQSGLYAAWWPSETDVSSADVTTSAGVFHQHFGDVGPDNPFG